MGALLWRGYGLDNIMAQCFGNQEDSSTKGKQMPVVCLAFSVEIRFDFTEQHQT